MNVTAKGQHLTLMSCQKCFLQLEAVVLLKIWKICLMIAICFPKSKVTTRNVTEVKDNKVLFPEM